MIKKSIVIGLLFIATSSLADGCPDINNMAFQTVAQYDQYRTSVTGQYTFPDFSAEAPYFPITFGQVKYVYLSNAQGVNKQAPFVGKPACYLSWRDVFSNQRDALVYVPYQAQTTSSDWVPMDNTTAVCTDQGNAQGTCSFSRVG